MSLNCPKMSPNRPKMSPNCPKMSPNCPKMSQSVFLKCIFPKWISPKCIFAKCTQLACLLSFASLLYEELLWKNSTQETQTWRYLTLQIFTPRETLAAQLWRKASHFLWASLETGDSYCFVCQWSDPPHPHQSSGAVLAGRDGLRERISFRSGRGLDASLLVASGDCPYVALKESRLGSAFSF